ncbi:MAG: 50S ribosomal protein L33 [Spirochaetaceae bacterium]|nr:MAG: 50S ribosomal protein L33 [Spirochaetaceae bacterium]
MAKKKGSVVIVKLKSSASPHCYYTKKNRKNIQGKLELRKYDPVARAHVVYHETGKL